MQIRKNQWQAAAWSKRTSESRQNIKKPQRPGSKIKRPKSLESERNKTESWPKKSAASSLEQSRNLRGTRLGGDDVAECSLMLGPTSSSQIHRKPGERRALDGSSVEGRSTSDLSSRHDDLQRGEGVQKHRDVASGKALQAFISTLDSQAPLAASLRPAPCAHPAVPPPLSDSPQAAACSSSAGAGSSPANAGQALHSTTPQPCAVRRPSIQRTRCGCSVLL